MNLLKGAYLATADIDERTERLTAALRDHLHYNHMSEICKTIPVMFKSRFVGSLWGHAGKFV